MIGQLQQRIESTITTKRLAITTASEQEHVLPPVQNGRAHGLVGLGGPVDVMFTWMSSRSGVLDPDVAGHGR